MTPEETLARSRLAIVEYLNRKERRHEEKEQEHESRQREHDAAGEHPQAGDSDGHWYSGIAGMASNWWRHHPAQMGLEMVTPMLQSYMRRRPFQVLAISAGVGALLVVTRPWRLISLTTLVVAVVKSSQLSGVVMSAIGDAQGWRSQQQGREPQL
jgi:hypothetical protein